MSKASNGAGSIYQRKSDGLWVGSIVVEVGTKTKRHVVYGKTQREARRKLKEMRDRADAGQPVKDSADTVEAWAKQ